jgi:hypothetical protein
MAKRGVFFLLKAIHRELLAKLATSSSSSSSY